MPAAALAIALLLPTPAVATWAPPVPGPPMRTFDIGTNPYAGGQHRGVDLRAAPGTPIRAPCAGRVVVAGQVATSGGVVTVLCGHWRVTLLPLATITARAGTPVTRGTLVGTLAPASTHTGLHLGVRRNGTRFGYVDPLRFLAADPPPPPPLGPAPRGRAPHPPPPPLGPAPGSPSRPIAAPRGDAPHPPSRPIAAPGRVVTTPAIRSGDAGLAPWPVWVGLALVLAGVGVRWRGTSRNRTRRQLHPTARLSE